MYFTPLILASIIASASALATPVHNVALHHRHASLAKARSPQPEPVISNFVSKRGLKKRCKSRGGAQTSTGAGDGVGNVAADPAADPASSVDSATEVKETSSSTEEAPAKTTATKEAAPTTEAPPPPPAETTKKTTTKKVTKTSTEAAKPTDSGSQDQGGSSGGNFGQFGGTMTGQGTWYATGLTACGVTNNDSEFIAAVSQDLFDNFPGAGANPNLNPVCGQKARVTFRGKSITVTITDRCTACKVPDLDFTPAAFKAIADLGEGRIDGISWHFI